MNATDRALSAPPPDEQASITVSEFPLNKHHVFRAEIVTTNGNATVRLSRWKKTASGGSKTTGQAFEFGAHRTRAVMNLLGEVLLVLQAQQPFYDGSEAEHGGVNADQAIALDAAALLKSEAAR